MESLEPKTPEQNLGSQEAKTEQAVPEQQTKLINGCLISLEEMLIILEEKGESKGEKGVLEELLSVVQESSSHNTALPAQFLNKLKLATLAVAEMTLVDEMAIDVKDENNIVDMLKRRYGRNHPPAFEGFIDEVAEKGINPKISYIFLDMATLKDDMEAMVDFAKKEINPKVWAFSGKNPDSYEKKGEKNIKLPLFVLQDISNIEELISNNKFKFIVLPEVIQSQEEDEKITNTIAQFLKDPSFNNIVVSGARVTDHVGVMQIFQGNNLRLRGSIYTKIHLPRQDQILAMLESGISFLSQESVKDKNSSDEETTEADRPASPQDLDKRLDDCFDSLVYLERGASDRYYRRKLKAFFSDSQDEEKFLKNHERHYRKFFAMKGREPDEIILTRSGLSANNLAIKALAETLPPATLAYYQPGWYYENEKPIKKLFKLAKKPEEARLLFINLDSCNPDDPEQFRKEQERLINDFLGKAKLDKGNNYALVVDVTTNLLWGDDLEVPENLALIKTFSLTKHQRGSRNYFYGGVASWNFQDMRSKMEADIDKLGGRLTTSGIIHFPRLRKTEIEDNLDHLRVLTQAFMEGVDQAQSDWPEELKIKVYPYNYYSYIVFPSKFKRRIQLVTDDKPITEKETRWSFGELAEPGDSFGLNKTRFTLVPKSESEVDTTVRFSFGIKEKKETTFKLGEEVVEKWMALLAKIMAEQEKSKDDVLKQSE